MKLPFFFFLSCFFTMAAAQPLVNQNIQSPGIGNTYAVIIGIASYIDTDITPLEFSNRDAVIFADFLMSAPGGKVPKENIKLLVDADATVGEVDKAIRWLVNTCQKDDQVFFYFSGHGALENVTMFNNGYLICYNSPSVAFVNMALSIDYLNDVVNTLSVKTNANVIVITDACHSGKMAGSKFKGNYLVGEQLLITKQKEIRMASCTPEQLSNEKLDWGGGRGVFSYHLVNGLQGGLADKNKDGTVTLGELKNYLETAMANDPVLKMENTVQTPVVKGKEDFKLSTVIESETIKIKQMIATDSVANVMVSFNMAREGDVNNLQPDAYFLSLLNKENLEAFTAFLQIDNMEAGEIAFSLINRIKEAGITGKHPGKITELESILKSDKEKLNSFNIDLGRAFNDIGQEVILHYLKGDEAELERRRYYNIKNNGYDIYPKMFAIALKLSQTDTYISTSTEVLMHYFSGVALRLKIPLTVNPAPLIDQALAEQQKALALEKYAAYIFNELGILYQYKKNYTAAEKNYLEATKLSPRWAIPYSNLCGMYSVQNKNEKAIEACKTADSLQTSLQPVSVNRGFINERMGNYLLAEEEYHEAININSRHYLPFERLGFVNMNTTGYAQADSFFYEADIRKRGYHFAGNDLQRIPMTMVLAPSIPMRCDIDTSILLPNDIFAFFTWGVQEYQKALDAQYILNEEKDSVKIQQFKTIQYANAARILKKIIPFDKTNPLVFHYLGKIYFDQQQWEAAEVMFKLALQYSMNETDFNHYVDSVKLSARYPYDHTCFERFFISRYYPQVEDYYFAGTIYENWKHVEEAEYFFRDIIEMEPDKDGGYIKLWRLLEKQGRYIEAEQVITEYGFAVSLDRADRELSEFYRRTLEKFPDDGNWNYKLGILMYKLAPFYARGPYFDTIVWFPVLNKELYIDMELYKKLGSHDSLSLKDKSATGSQQAVYLSGDTDHEMWKDFEIPGTKENIILAGPIYLPRKDGITYLKKAAGLLAEKETLADINFKIGNIYLWAGSKKQAHPYLEKSLELVADNANARLKLVDIYKDLFKNKAALAHLNYLHDSSQINFEKRMLLAQFNIHAGGFKKAKQLLDIAEAIHPYMVPEIEDLRGRLSMLNNKPKEAIEFYYRSLNASEMYPGNEVKTFTGSTLYTLSRLYAKTGNNMEALKWLQSAIDFGFNYSFVLQNDPYMDKLRKTAKWRTLVSSITAKTYASNFKNN